MNIVFTDDLCLESNKLILILNISTWMVFGFVPCLLMWVAVML